MEQTIFTSIPVDQLAKQLADEIAARFPQQPTNTNVHEKFLSAKEAAELLGITIPTLRKWRMEGLIPYHRVGSRIYFDYNEIEEAVKNAGSRRMKKAYGTASTQPPPAVDPRQLRIP